MSARQPHSQGIEDRSEHSWHKERSNEKTDKSDKVSKHSSVRLKMRSNGMNPPDQNTRCDLDRVIEELKEMKKIHKDQQSD